MTNAELMDALVDAFGSEQRLADAIPPVNRRMVLRWVNGTHPVPPGVWADVVAALGKRIARLEQLRAAAATALKSSPEPLRRDPGDLP